MKRFGRRQAQFVAGMLLALLAAAYAGYGVLRGPARGRASPPV